MKDKNEEMYKNIREFLKEHYNDILGRAKQIIDLDKERGSKGEIDSEEPFISLATMALFLSSEKLEKLTRCLKWLTIILVGLTLTNIGLLLFKLI